MTQCFFVLILVVLIRCGDIHIAARSLWSQKCRNGIFLDILSSGVVGQEVKNEQRYVWKGQILEEDNKVYLSRSCDGAGLGVRV